MARSSLILLSAAIAIAALSGGCFGTSFYVEPQDGEPVDLFRSSDVFDEDAGPINVVLRSQHDWEQFLDNYAVSDRDFLRERFYRVDFSRHMVVGVVLGSTWGGSVNVNIDFLREQNQQLVVYATEYHPSVQTGDWSNPAHFVVIPRTNLPVQFAEVEVIVEEEGNS